MLVVKLCRFLRAWAANVQVEVLVLVVLSLLPVSHAGAEGLGK